MSNDFKVDVAGISPQTTTEHLHDFFAFCGSIKRIDHSLGSSTAVIAFEKPTSARTALMLSGGSLDGEVLTVTSEVPYEDELATKDQPLDQADKPRAGIIAELLAKGYKLSDSVLERAIDLDNKQGISKRFLDYFHSIDKTIGERTLGPDQTVSGKVQSSVEGAAQQARSIDEQKGISKIANDYYEKAITSPFGQRVKAFYTDTSKQIKDIHEEARRIAETQKTSKEPTPVPTN